MDIIKMLPGDSQIEEINWGNCPPDPFVIEVSDYEEKDQELLNAIKLLPKNWSIHHISPEDLSENIKKALLDSTAKNSKNNACHFDTVKLKDPNSLDLNLLTTHNIKITKLKLHGSIDNFNEEAVTIIVNTLKPDRIFMNFASGQKTDAVMKDLKWSIFENASYVIKHTLDSINTPAKIFEDVSALNWTKFNNQLHKAYQLTGKCQWDNKENSIQWAFYLERTQN
ncbi:MAG: hypothetical protein JSR80_01810 [Verrucomicrobia bacterium]|nr:hypothetical protein [Verrucomicrobiota bacterium]